MLKINKIQKEIEELAGRVPSLTKRQTEWAKRMFPYEINIIGQRPRDCVCPECKGEIHFPESRSRQKIRCPHCGAIIVGHRHFDSYGRKWNKNGVNYGWNNNHQERFFCVMNVVGDWQVTRLFYMERWVYIRKDNTPWGIYECCQAWNKPTLGKTYFRSLPKQGMGYHYNPYCLHRFCYERVADAEKAIYTRWIYGNTELEAREPNSANFFHTTDLAPDAKILPYFRQIGFTARAIRRIDCDAMAVFADVANGKFLPMHETLLKCGAYEVFNKITERRANAPVIFTAWKICQRNGYNYKKNLTEWFDLVNLLSECGLDYHNPHYVCPDNIHDMHQRMILRINERMEEEKVLRALEEQNKKYTERIAKYLDLEIRKGDLTIKVLPDIPSFKREGDALGHCVYRCHYYDKVDSLILTARGTHNKRWETIEVDLKKFRILQCYGYGDKHTERHKEIIDLVNENMWQIKERRLRKTDKANKTKKGNVAVAA